MAFRYGVQDQEWSLLFRASRDGFHAKDFHAFSDNQGPTLILIKVKVTTLAINVIFKYFVCPCIVFIYMYLL